jgi:hypothetical protein
MRVHGRGQPHEPKQSYEQEQHLLCETPFDERKESFNFIIKHGSFAPFSRKQLGSPP